MSGEITIRPLDLRANEAELLAAQAIHFTGADAAAKRAAFVPWLLADPVPGSFYLGAYVDGQFASFLGMLARRTVGFGREFRTALAIAAVTLPEFAGRGLYRRLAEAAWAQAAAAGFDFAVGYTIRSYVLRIELRMGWAAASTAPVMAFPLDLPAVLRTAMPALGGIGRLAAPLNPLAQRAARWLAKRAAGGDYDIAPGDGFGAEYDALTLRLREAGLIHFAKDRQTLDWLYHSPFIPFAYDHVEARRDGELLGFAVGRRMDLLGLDGYGILDLVAAPGHEAALRPLAARLVGGALPRRPQIIGALVSAAQPPQHALRGLGFVDSRRSFTLIYRPLGDDLPEALPRSESWANFWGNNDTN